MLLTIKHIKKSQGVTNEEILRIADLFLPCLHSASAFMNFGISRAAHFSMQNHCHLKSLASGWRLGLGFTCVQFHLNMVFLAT